MKVELEPLSKESAEQITDVGFYCRQCDGAVIKTDDYSTGRFFIAAGHVVVPRQDDYVGILFAVCCDCLKGSNEDTQV